VPEIIGSIQTLIVTGMDIPFDWIIL